MIDAAKKHHCRDRRIDKTKGEHLHDGKKKQEEGKLPRERKKFLCTETYFWFRYGVLFAHKFFFMQRNALQIPDEYLVALSERFAFDLLPESLATRVGKAYIVKQAGIVSGINRGLTQSRESFLASGYLKSKEIREAYALYYMTTNLLKVIQPLRELSLSKFFERSELRILDLGSGTGAAAWGIMHYLRSEEKNI